MNTDPIEIPASQLSPETLRALVESFIMREGTDYGEREYSLEEKVEQVFLQLNKGKAKILFDLVSESPTLVLKEQLR